MMSDEEIENKFRQLLQAFVEIRCTAEQVLDMAEKAVVLERESAEGWEEVAKASQRQLQRWMKITAKMLEKLEGYLPSDVQKQVRQLRMDVEAMSELEPGRRH